MFFVVHYTFSFDGNAASIPSAILFGVGFNGQTQPVDGCIVPEPAWVQGAFHFKYKIGDRAFTAQKVVLHPSVTGAELRQKEIPHVSPKNAMVLYMHLMTHQVDVHCKDFADAVRQRDAAYAYLTGLLDAKNPEKAKAGIAYVLPLKADPQP